MDFDAKALIFQKRVIKYSSFVNLRSILGIAAIVLSFRCLVADRSLSEKAKNLRRLIITVYRVVRA